jgi:hypothetical protein
VSLAVTAVDLPTGSDACSQDWVGLGYELTPTASGCIRVSTQPQIAWAASTIAEADAVDLARGKAAMLFLATPDDLGSTATPAEVARLRAAANAVAVQFQRS